jgi:hypothetical protein
MDTLKTFFKKWRTEVSIRRYDDWCETEKALKVFQEIKQEEEDKRENAMESIHWYDCDQD